MLRPANRHLVAACLATAFTLPLACGGSSEFSSGGGEAGDPSTGGTSAGASGASSGGVAGTAAVGGTSGSSTGGSGGTTSGGTTSGGSGGTANGGTGSGGTDAGGAGGAGSMGGTGGATGGSAGRGGTGQGGIQTGGTGGQMGGSAGVGGMPDSRCPLRNPTGTSCDANGLECRYDLARNCLCITVVQPGFCSVWDPRCDAMMGAAPPPPDAGGIAIPVSTQTCQCSAGTWACRYP